MDKQYLGKKILGNLLVMIFILTGCMPSDVPTANTRSNVIPGGESGKSGTNATGDSTTSATMSIPPKVELRHLIEPNLSTDPNYSSGTGYAGGGSYVRKLTLPKNFQGRLYLAGVNIGTLMSRYVKVRFKFGVGREPIIIPATVTQAPGITPQTNIHVLVMDMRSEPFRNVRLPYDLFDYNEYAVTDTPTQDNRDSGLYCRGLKVEDDPTFQGVGACDGAESTPNEEECHYAYAKVLDQGLVKETLVGSTNVRVPITPSLPQVKSIAGSNYFQDYQIQELKKPLLDAMPAIGSTYKFSDLAVPANVTDSQSINFTNFGNLWSGVKIPLVTGPTYYYRGPYRLVNQSQWEFKFPAYDGPNKLFKINSFVGYIPSLAGPNFPLSDDSQTSILPTNLYFNSYLFPLATKLDLPAGVPHLSSPAWDGIRTEKTLATAGKTDWMDGSNARVQSKNSDLEHVGSCNVSASIEVFALDDNNNEFIIATSKDVKIQLVRPSQYKTDTGNEVLFTNFKTCSSNATCGGSECCFNNRCWDESLVSQCFDSTSIQGNRTIGDTCVSDLECSSLCCNRTTGHCAAHNTILNPAVLCSKPTGDFCIAKEWCAKSPVVTCLVVKTGTDAGGNTTCRQQCFTTNEFGDCKNGICSPPVQAAIPTFDPNDPAACDAAVPPPNFSN